MVGALNTTVIAAPLWLPASSRAVIVIRLAPFRSAIQLTAQVVVPTACPWTPWSVAQMTWVVCSGAVPPKLIVPCEDENVGWDVGDVMITAPTAPVPPLGTS